MLVLLSHWSLPIGVQPVPREFATGGVAWARLVGAQAMHAASTGRAARLVDAVRCMAVAMCCDCAVLGIEMEVIWLTTLRDL